MDRFNNHRASCYYYHPLTSEREPGIEITRCWLTSFAQQFADATHDLICYREYRTTHAGIVL